MNSWVAISPHLVPTIISYWNLQEELNLPYLYLQNTTRHLWNSFYLLPWSNEIVAYDIYSLAILRSKLCFPHWYPIDPFRGFPSELRTYVTTCTMIHNPRYSIILYKFIWKYYIKSPVFWHSLILFTISAGNLYFSYVCNISYKFSSPLLLLLK